MSLPSKPDIPGRQCKICGKPITRKRYPNSLETYGRYIAREHCSQACANTRSSSAIVEDTHRWRARKFRGPACENCGTTADLHVHHVDCVPSNNARSNLRTLCASCHLKLHWAEDYEKRCAAAIRRAPQACAICGDLFKPRHAHIQTCSARCKAALLSIRTSAYYAKRGAA